MFSFFKKKNASSDSASKYETYIIEDYENAEPIAQYFQTETGITFEKQTSILKSKLTIFCKNKQISSFKSCLEKIHIDQQLKQELINYLTTNESYFYRELRQIQELVSKVAGSQSKVSILCAPCSTGEEPYSIAMELFNAGIDSNRFTITALDINTNAIQFAQKACYNARSVSKLPATILQRYFHELNGKYQLQPKVVSTVGFYVMNIFSLEFQRLGKFDFVFSRNMLIYFDRPTKQKARKILEDVRSTSSQEVFFGHADLF